MATASFADSIFAPIVQLMYRKIIGIVLVLVIMEREIKQTISLCFQKNPCRSVFRQGF